MTGWEIICSAVLISIIAGRYLEVLFEAIGAALILVVLTAVGVVWLAIGLVLFIGALAWICGVKVRDLVNDRLTRYRKRQEFQRWLRKH